jgi:hypothetical protein
MNQDKTELIIFAPKRRAKELTDISISLGGNIILKLGILVHYQKRNQLQQGR